MKTKKMKGNKMKTQRKHKNGGDQLEDEDQAQVSPAT